MMSGDCSSCAITGTEAAATTVSTQSTGDSCCPLKEGSEATATMVATETAGESCSAEKSCEMESSCSDGAAKAELVSTTAESCESACTEKAACEGEAAAVELVSTTGEASECGSACAGDACGKDADACCGKCDAGKELAKAPQ